MLSEQSLTDTTKSTYSSPSSNRYGLGLVIVFLSITSPPHKRKTRDPQEVPDSPGFHESKEPSASRGTAERRRYIQYMLYISQPPLPGYMSREKTIELFN